MKETVTLYLVDDHQIVIDGLKLLIKNELNLNIIGSANDGDAAFKEILTLKPDIALIDLRMPGKNGIQLIINLKNKVNTRFIILSMQYDMRYIIDANKNGAWGYLRKDAGKKELIDCISNVISGEKYFPEKYKSYIENENSIFTPREMDILKLVIGGKTTVQIANELNLSHFTVETHRKNIGRKTNTKTLTGLINYAYKNNIQEL